MESLVSEIKFKLTNALVEAINTARAAGEVNLASIPAFIIEVPREKEHGDFATNLALMLAKPARMSPRQIAEIIVRRLNLSGTWVKKIEIASPGFINFFLEPSWVLQGLPQIEKKGCNYGRLNIGQGREVQVEFVSANPTGLLHMGNARGAALGDSIASILDFAGYKVTREFYINDAGNQIENFGKSLEARYLQAFGYDIPVPEEGYHGEDVAETVGRFIAEFGEKHLKSGETVRRKALINYALKEKLTAIKDALADFGVYYDVWFSESKLHESGEVFKTLKLLEEADYLYEKDDAIWFKASAFGAEKDEVVIRGNGMPTYFAADIAYHKNKFDRGFKWVINIWGADHHGHVSRVKGAMKALGYNSDALDVIIMQLVRLLRGGEIVRMSKRTGKFITLEELVEEVGRDAARYFFVMRSADSHLDFDLDLAKAQVFDNPVYYIQYAHARICSIFRQLAEQGRARPEIKNVDLSLLVEEAELALTRRLVDFPEEVAWAARDMAPHRLAGYLYEVAGLFHSFYNNHRVIVEDEKLAGARLALVNATWVVLKNALRLLGISAPERM